MMRGLPMDIASQWNDQSIAVLALTRGGSQLGLRLYRALGPSCHLYLPERLNEVGAEEAIYFAGSLKDLVGSIFKKYRALVFISAAGIAVRIIAPLLKGKMVDPAVVVMDEAGKYAISLLSGHQGGANSLADYIEQAVGAQAVITTATDVRGLPAIEMRARDYACLWEPLPMLPVINRWIVETGGIRVLSHWPLPWDDLAVEVRSPGEIPLDPKIPTVCVSNRLLSVNAGAPYLFLRPRNLVVGIGCRRGVSESTVLAAVKAVFAQAGLSVNCIKSLATVDLKADESGLHATAVLLGVKLVTVARHRIREVEERFSCSEFVFNNIGVGGVCEPAAWLISNQGELIVKKQKMGPVTVAVVEERSWW
ncbi:MAG: cobalt-precorrin 5A hydrolase [Bacillota bacterium]